MNFDLKAYVTQSGSSPYDEWFSSLTTERNHQMNRQLAIPLDDIIIRRLKSDPKFATEMFKSSVESLFEGDFHYALRTLRCIVKAGIGFSALSKAVGISSQNLHRALSDRGNPTIRTLNKILTAIADFLGIPRPQPSFG